MTQYKKALIFFPASSWMLSTKTRLTCTLETKYRLPSATSTPIQANTILSIHLNTFKHSSSSITTTSTTSSRYHIKLLFSNMKTPVSGYMRKLLQITPIMLQFLLKYQFKNFVHKKLGCMIIYMFLQLLEASLIMII